MGLYQGNGNFLMTQTGYNITTDCYVDSELVYASDIANTYMCYYVLRPDQINQTDDSGSGDTGETGGLTEAQQAALAAITAADYQTATESRTITNLTGFAPWVYEFAGIEVSDYFDQSVFNMAAKLFNKNSTLPWTVKTDDSNYLKMLVGDYYGGKAFVGGSSKSFTAGDFEIGDLFCGYTQETVDGSTVRTYYIGLYQGNGNFLMMTSDGGWACNPDSVTVFSADIATFFQCYYVLRPSQVINATQE